MKIAFLGFGEAARAFHHSLKALDPTLEFIAWDILLDDETSADAMRSGMAHRKVEIARDRAGLASPDWIFSAVTADQSLIAIEALAPYLRPGQLVIDINSVSPGRKRQTSALVEGAGATYLDMAVMAPVDPRGHRTPVLLAGPQATEVEPTLGRLEFSYRVVSGEAGAATAIKMVRSLFVKGLEAITVETLLAAEASGCFQEIYDSISASYPGLGWPDFAGYEFERTTRHGKRRAAEMHESAATLNALGLNGNLASEIARVQEQMGGLVTGDATPDGLAERIGAILAERRRAAAG